MPDIDYAQLAKELLGQVGAQQKAVVGTTINFVPGHGPGGLFSHPALERPVFSQMILPQAGLQSILPVHPARTTNPLYGIFTGVTATTGSEPTNKCDDPPYVGLSKLCMHQFVFGRYSRRTRVMELDAFGKLADRGDHEDLILYGNPSTGFAGNPNVPTLPGGGNGNMLSNDILNSLTAFGAAWARDFARTFYTGNPANNTAGNGYMEFYGMEYLINTGYRDAVTGTVCPAADSYIASFGDKDVCINNGVDIVDQLDAMWMYLERVATESGLDPVRSVLVMRSMLFDLLTGCWMSFGCAGRGSWSSPFTSMPNFSAVLTIAPVPLPTSKKETGIPKAAKMQNRIVRLSLSNALRPVSHLSISASVSAIVCTPQWLAPAKLAELVFLLPLQLKGRF